MRCPASASSRQPSSCSPCPDRTPGHRVGRHLLACCEQGLSYSVRPPTPTAQLDSEQHPFTKAVASHMRNHDDHEQFLARIDFFLAGVGAIG